MAGLTPGQRRPGTNSETCHRPQCQQPAVVPDEQQVAGRGQAARRGVQGEQHGLAPVRRPQPQPAVGAARRHHQDAAVPRQRRDGDHVPVRGIRRQRVAEPHVERLPHRHAAVAVRQQHRSAEPEREPGRRAETSVGGRDQAGVADGAQLGRARAAGGGGAPDGGGGPHVHGMPAADGHQVGAAVERDGRERDGRRARMAERLDDHDSGCRVPQVYAAAPGRRGHDGPTVPESGEGRDGARVRTAPATPGCRAAASRASSNPTDGRTIGRWHGSRSR